MKISIAKSQCGTSLSVFATMVPTTAFHALAVAGDPPSFSYKD